MRTSALFCREWIAHQCAQPRARARALYHRGSAGREVITATPNSSIQTHVRGGRLRCSVPQIGAFIPGRRTGRVWPAWCSRGDLFQSLPSRLQPSSPWHAQKRILWGALSPVGQSVPPVRPTAHSARTPQHGGVNVPAVSLQLSIHAPYARGWPPRRIARELCVICRRPCDSKPAPGLVVAKA